LGSNHWRQRLRRRQKRCLPPYVALLSDQSFQEALTRTLIFLVINLPIQLVLGMAIALLLHKPGNELLKKIGRISLVVPLAQRIGFRVFDQGMASAQAVVMLVIATILSRLYVKYVYKEIHERL
jgi:ABC-type sugar transport system permease subunit